MFNIPLVTPALGHIFKFLYDLTHNFGMTIILFTLITRAAMLPLSIKQQKSSLKMVRIKPKMDAIQKKYKNNKDKLNQAMQDLYKEEGYNPLSGCLPSLLPLVILFGLFRVIYMPLTYALNLSEDVISKAGEIVTGILEKPVGNMEQIQIITNINNRAFVEMDGFDKIRTFAENFKIFNLPLTGTPSISNPSLWWILPILCGVTAFLSGFISQKMNPAMKMNDQPGMGGMGKMMMYGMPLFSVWIAFTVPAGIGFYWLISNLVMILQTVLMNYWHNPNKIIAQMEAEEAARPPKKKVKKQEKEQLSEARKQALSDFDE